MTLSSISKTVHQTVTLGSVSYAGNLTITAAGTVAPTVSSAPGLDGVFIPSSGGDALLNKGRVFGGAGLTGTIGTAGDPNGGPDGGIGGGAGGAGYTGGSGIYLAGLGSVTNNALVTGGTGGVGGAGGNGTGDTGAAAGAGPGGNGGMGGAGIDLAGAGTLSNTNTIIGGAGGAGGAPGTYTVLAQPAGYGGTGGTGVILDNGAVFINTGLVTGGIGGANEGTGGTAVYLDGGTLVNGGTIEGGAAGSGGTEGAAISFGAVSSLLVLDAGSRITGDVFAQSGAQDTLGFSGTSTVELTNIGLQFTNFSSLSFASGASWTIAGFSTGLASNETIIGLTKTDKIDLEDFAATSETFASNQLVLNGTAGSSTLDIVGSLTSANFSISSDGASGTFIQEVTCFARGTRIATAQGELPVEQLTIGMEVETRDGGLQPIKWIGQRSYAAPFANNPKLLPILIKADAIAPNMPARDLLVSPGHAICINGALIQAQRLVNGVTIKQLRKVDLITYFHIEMDSHQVLLAENCPAESFRGEHFRGQFENAASFQALYPGAAAPEAPCLPELKQGFVLQAILEELDARAGIAPPRPRVGPLRGEIEHLESGVLIGWAQDLSAPDQPVLLDIFVGETLYGRIIANLYRDDLRERLGGSGAYGFEMHLPPELAAAAAPGEVRVRRTADQAMLTPSGVAVAVA